MLHHSRFNTAVVAAKTAVPLLAVAATTLTIVSCTADHPISPPDEAKSVVVCDQLGSAPSLVAVGPSELPQRLSNGAYVAQLVVDKSVTPGDGVHYTTITDALAAARALRLARKELQSSGCRITILVAPGKYTAMVTDANTPGLEKLPLVIDVPNITLKGALNMLVDGDDRALPSESAPASTLAPNAPLKNLQQGLDETIIEVIGHPNGSAGNGADIEGFAFQSGHVDVDKLKGGFGVFGLRVTDLVIKSNRFELGLTSAIDLRASSGRVERNYISDGAACDVCLAGPGTYLATDNRVLGGGIDGFLVQPVVSFQLPAGIEPYDIPATASVTATIVNNEVRDHVRTVGVGVRLATIGSGTPNVPTSSKVDINGNTLYNNTFGIQVEAGFPVANTTLRGDAEVSLKDNRMNSCQRDLLVLFTRHTTALGTGQLTRPYIRNSTYKISLGGNLAWDDAWYSDPDGFGNTLIVDGAQIPNGARLPYDASRTCAS